MQWLIYMYSSVLFSSKGGHFLGSTLGTDYLLLHCQNDEALLSGLLEIAVFSLANRAWLHDRFIFLLSFETGEIYLLGITLFLCSFFFCSLSFLLLGFHCCSYLKTVLSFSISISKTRSEILFPVESLTNNNLASSHNLWKLERMF